MFILACNEVRPDVVTAFSAKVCFVSFNCPALDSSGAASRGDTRDEALKNIRDVLQLDVEDLIGEGEAIPPDALIASVESPAVVLSI